MEKQIINVKCDDNLKLLLPILKNKIETDSPDNISYESYGSSSESSESLDSEIYNFDKELDDENILFLLNTIGQTYLSGEGFVSNEPVGFNNKLNNDLINSFIEESKEKDYYINESLDDKLNIDLDFFIEKALITIPYTKVIIQYNQHFSVVCDCNIKWITIDDQNSQIIISRNNKKLTIDDILYATRIIAVTYGRKIDFMIKVNDQEFSKLNNDNDILTLKY